MKVYLNNVTGVDDALVSLLMSKRTWTREKEEQIRRLVGENLTREGFLNTDDTAFLGEIDKLIKYGVTFGHTTLLRYVDVSYTVEGLHRGAQDDFDSHAKRLDNRIVRSSTRLATFENGEKSGYYEGKILYPLDICMELGIELPDEITKDGKTFKRVHFGYVDSAFIGTREENDVKRGLYPLGIPSNFIFKAQLPEFAHIVQHRDSKSQANPELIEMIEKAKGQLIEKFKPLGKQLVKIKMQRSEDE